MSTKKLAAIGILLICLFAFSAYEKQQSCISINRKQLREMIAQLGYEIKDTDINPGKEKYEITTTRNGVDIPITLQISGNEVYVWLTVFLGAAKTENAAKNLALLQQTAKTQPCHFYITETGKLMIGVSLENRGITNTLLRERIETIASRVGESKAVWQ